MIIDVLILVFVQSRTATILCEKMSLRRLRLLRILQDAGITGAINSFVASCCSSSEEQTLSLVCVLDDEPLTLSFSVADAVLWTVRRCWIVFNCFSDEESTALTSLLNCSRHSADRFSFNYNFLSTNPMHPVLDSCCSLRNALSFLFVIMWSAFPWLMSKRLSNLHYYWKQT